MRRLVSLAVVSALGMSVLIGCSQPRPVVMAPPVSQNPGYAGAQPAMGGNMAPPGTMNPSGGSVYQYQDVPVNQDVPITRATFDQGGYQIFAQSGETIVVPFANNNMYVMKFGRTGGQAFFRNENGVPVLYLRPGEGLENAAAQGARWYPIPQDYAYTQPMYVAMAPTWNDYTNMGWYPGMTYYGGMWGYTPYSHFNWMPGWYISVGGHRYSDYHNYYSYYNSTPGYIRNRVVYTNYNAPRSVAGRSFGSTGSYSGGRSTGSFGSGRVTGSSGGFGNRPSGSTRTTFGGSTPSGSSGTFGSRPATGSGSFGTRTPSASGGAFGSRPAGSSFGGGSSGYSNTSRPSGSSFGGGSGRSSGSSFGGSSSSSGRSSGSSFGGGSGRSTGSFGGGRRR